MFLKFIPTATTAIRTTFSKFDKTLGPGLRFYIPIIQKVHIVSNRLQQDKFRFQVKTVI